MRNRFSIRRKLMVSTLLGCLVPFIAGFFAIQTQTEQWLYTSNLEHTQVILQQAAEHVDQAILGNMKGLTALVAADKRLLHADTGLTRYMDFSPELLTQQKSPSELEIRAFFGSILENYPLIAFISFGSIDGGYVEYPDFKPTTSYDPRERGWYKGALVSRGAFISEPYETKVSKELVISVDDTVEGDEGIIGVVSLTIRLDSIMDYIGGIDVGKTGYINIISPGGRFISSPSNPEWLMKSVEEMEEPFLNDLLSHASQSFEGRIGNSEKVFTLHISPSSGWKYLSVTDRSEVLNHSRSLSGTLILVFLAIAVLIILLMLIIARRITHPILTLAQIIEKMANFDFDSYEHKKIDSFLKYRDEIGTISTALSGMQNNFLELKSSMDDMDGQIKGIQVEEQSLKRLVLSKGNPFRSVSDSVNGLLDKVSSYLARIREYNTEISRKNELLVSSEEKLLAQLEEINSQKDHIHYLANHDPLTDLPNRRSFQRVLRDALTSQEKGAVILLDMDNFKSVNDTLGHLFGDKLLIAISRRLAENAAPNTFVTRFGGDEFLILFQSQRHAPDLNTYINRLKALFDMPFPIEGLDIRVEFSMGIARFPDDSDNIEHAIMYADLAMYEVKKRGKNNHAFFTGAMAAHLRFRQETKALLKEALAQDGFKLVYQPQVRLSDGQVEGYEALLRLKDNPMSPGVFIRIAEEEGLILPIGRMVARMAVEQMRAWNDKGLPAKPISLNYSALQLEDIGFAAYLLDLLKTHHVSAEYLQLEITEHIFLENKTEAIRFLGGLRRHGIRIAVDDFGSEYSSLSYLSTLPIDTLKFDRELNLRLLDHEEPSVMEKLIAFVHSLHLRIVAEGVENPAHVRTLRDGGCDVIQGYCFSRPMDAAEVENTYDRVYEP